MQKQVPAGIKWPHDWPGILFSSQKVIAVVSMAVKPLASNSLNDTCSNGTRLLLRWWHSKTLSTVVPLRTASAPTAKGALNFCSESKCSLTRMKSIKGISSRSTTFGGSQSSCRISAEKWVPCSDTNAAKDNNSSLLKVADSPSSDVGLCNLLHHKRRLYTRLHTNLLEWCLKQHRVHYSRHHAVASKRVSIRHWGKTRRREDA